MQAICGKVLFFNGKMHKSQKQDIILVFVLIILV